VTGETPELPEHVARNRAAWDGWAQEYVGAGERDWAAAEATWGIWGLPESTCGMFPADVAEMDTIELGCGTGYVSAWLARRGARPVGIDNSEVQLATARRLQAEHGLDFPLHHGNAETTPFPDASFDLVISEYGASIWCDPYRWIPEAARLLRPGGRLHFLVNSPWLMLFMEDDGNTPAGERLLRPYFGMHRFEWPGDPSVDFHLGHGEMIRLLRDCGFEVEALVELQAPEGASTGYPFVTPEWAHRWPSEEVWRAVKRP
jgi:SAM-dependent methyltransferase